VDFGTRLVSSRLPPPREHLRQEKSQSACGSHRMHTFRRLKAHKQLPLLKVALADRKASAASANRNLDEAKKAA
jgi:hypothetical protein